MFGRKPREPAPLNRYLTFQEPPLKHVRDMKDVVAGIAAQESSDPSYGAFLFPGAGRVGYEAAVEYGGQLSGMQNHTLDTAPMQPLRSEHVPNNSMAVFFQEFWGVELILLQGSQLHPTAEDAAVEHATTRLFGDGVLIGAIATMPAAAIRVRVAQDDLLLIDSSHPYAVQATTQHRRSLTTY
jgi:hypothetical protein